MVETNVFVEETSGQKYYMRSVHNVLGSRRDDSIYAIMHAVEEGTCVSVRQEVGKGVTPPALGD